MEYRQIGGSGLMVSAMTLGTMAFSGKNKFAEVGTVGVDEARGTISLGQSRFKRSRMGIAGHYCWIHIDKLS